MRSPWDSNFIKRWTAIPLATLISTLLFAWPTGTQAASPSTPITIQRLTMESAQVGWGVHWYEAHPTAGFTGQLLHTADGGHKWSNVTPPRVTFNTQGGPPTLPHNTVTDFVSRSTAWTATELSVSAVGTGTMLLSVTHDGGVHWQQWTVKLPKLSDTAVFNPIVDQVAFVHGHDGCLIFGPTTGPDGGMDPSGMELWHTTNGGHTWTRRYETAQGINVSPIAFNGVTSGWMIFNLPQKNIPLGVDALERSTNGGRTWRLASVGFISGLALTRMPPTFDGTQGLLLTTLGVFAVLHTANGQPWSGLTTTPILVPSRWTGQTIGARIIWLVTPTKLWRSTNAGQTWTTQGVPVRFTQQMPSLDFLNGRVGWFWKGPATQQAKLWMTTDGGRSWTSWTPMVVQ